MARTEGAVSVCPANSPAYDLEIVSRTVLEEVILRYRERLTVPELSLRIVGDPDDERETKTVADAIHDLRASGLIEYEDADQLVKATPAILRYVALVGSP